MNFLWLTKVSLVETTAKECNKWGLTMIPVTGTTQEKQSTISLLRSMVPAGMPFHVVTNYETLNVPALLAELLALDLDVVVIDEVHRLKGGANSTPTKIWLNAKKLLHHQQAKNPNFKQMQLSGSLINNKIGDMFAYLHLFDPARFDTLSNFERTFGNMELIQGLGYTPTRLLKALSPTMIRRTKKEVAQDLPDKTVLEPEVLVVNPNSDFGKIKRQLTEDVLIEMDSIDDDAPFTVTSMLAKLHYLRALNVAPGVLQYTPYTTDPETGERVKGERRTFTFEAPYPKLSTVYEDVQDLIAEGEQALVFSAQFNGPIQHLHDQAIKDGYRSGLLIGGSNYTDLQSRFQQAELDVLWVNLKSGAEGLNLHRCNDWPGGASHVYFLDRWYNPQLNLQGEDRCYRIGTNNPVFIHKYYIKDSVDFLIAEMEERKLAEGESVTESTVFRASAWKELLHQHLGA